jgi:putative aminopeptidase FrvX
MEKIFKQILRFNQSELHDYLINYVSNYYDKIINNEDFIYCKGNIPVLLVAHLDTIYNSPENIYYDSQKNIAWSPDGIGGDDKCGVFIIHKIISDNFKPHILFCHDEEIGTIGAKEAIKYLNKPKINYMIGLDRRGNNQAVFYNCGNKNFQNFILSYGFELKYGTYSDISILAPHWDISAVNLSVGFYNEHTQHEYINLNHMNNTLRKVKSILLSNNTKQYDFQTISKYYSNDFNYIDDLIDSKYYKNYYKNNQWKKWYGEDYKKYVKNDETNTD